MRQSLLVAALAVVSSVSCGTGTKPRDVTGRWRTDGGAGPTESTVPPVPARPDAAPVAAGQRPRRIARASCRALALDATRIYYGDNDDDALYTIGKTGGVPQRLARRAPVAGGLAIDGGEVSWIATPGDVVLQVATVGGTPTTLREHEIFADVGAQGGEVLVAQVVGGGGAVTRLAAVAGASAGAGASASTGANVGANATRIASFEGAPRAIVVDATSVFVATSTKILKVPRARGEVETLATGSGFESPALDETSIYVVAAAANGGHDVLRIGKSGGAAAVVATDVRAAPIAVDGGVLFYLDAQRPELRAVPAGGGTPRVVSEDDVLTRVSAIAVDESTVYLATGEREDGAIQAIARAP